MILGIGTDIIEIERIEGVLQRYPDRFLDRILTGKEKEYCQKYVFSTPHVAGRFAAKEAVSKALGSGFREGFTFHDIEILNDIHGKPVVTLSPRLMERFDNPKILLSISHSKEFATATAIWDR
jgi:holo-[acyl-carrier protein] synthase